VPERLSEKEKLSTGGSLTSHRLASCDSVKLKSRSNWGFTGMAKKPTAAATKAEAAPAAKASASKAKPEPAKKAAAAPAPTAPAKSKSAAKKK
jgi:hypothetical protein